MIRMTLSEFSNLFMIIHRHVGSARPFDPRLRENDVFAQPTNVSGSDDEEHGFPEEQ